MRPSYKDIRSRIAESPNWYDDHGVPRYGDFTPTNAANLYASEAVLAEIKCQGCGQLYRVSFSYNVGETIDPVRPLAQHIRAGQLDYGDPPNACCHVGATMSSIPIRVLEYWSFSFPPNGGWHRDASLEVTLSP